MGYIRALGCPAQDGQFIVALTGEGRLSCLVALITFEWGNARFEDLEDIVAVNFIVLFVEFLIWV